MSLSQARVLERLAADEPCLAGLFLTYGFDPSFFEDHVLRAVLRLSSDPVEQPVRYHDEALRALQVTPVAVFVDAGERQPGRRLPYDVLDVAQRVFHPKVAVLAYEKFCRVHIGSGNLTSVGYGSNTELFVTLDLRYDEPEDAALLADLLGSVDRLTKLAKTSGSQHALVLDELKRRLPEVDPPASATMVWLDSTKGALLDQALTAVPAGAKVRHVGLMAPFYERDDGAAAESMTSVFGRLRSFAGPDAGLDVGVLWDNAPVLPEAHAMKVEERLGTLWAWREKDEETGEDFIEYLVPTKSARTQLHYTDEDGEPDSISLETVSDALERQVLWPVEAPVVFAPPAALESAKASFASLQMWFHPSTRLVEGRPLHRPLHAKLLAIQYEYGGELETLVVVGSANASRKALLLSTQQGGNAELCLALRVRKPLRLPDLAPELVAGPLAEAEVREREFPELSANWSLAITAATYDAATRELRVEWETPAPFALPGWALKYRDSTIAEGSGTPEGPTVRPDFDLHRDSAELVLAVGLDTRAIPILVRDLVALPVGPGEGLLGLHELLLLLGRRVGRERLTMLAEQRAAAEGTASAGLEDAFGTGFAPTDVFKAWWTVAEDIAAPEASVGSVRLRLEGALGVGTIWAHMLAAASDDSPYSPEMIWFYGAELHRELGAVQFPSDATGARKQALVEAFLNALRTGLEGLVQSDAARPWLQSVRTFYGVSR